MVSDNVIGAATRVHGSITGAGSVTILGTVDGEVNLEGDLVVDKGGEVRAGVQAANVTVAGSVRGDVRAERTISVGPGGYVQGSLNAPSIAIHPEARLDGRISMPLDLPASLARSSRESRW